MTSSVDVAIVGAGIAGLVAARELHSRGRSVLLLDKGRGVGGRLATRHFAEGPAFDHGAQFFTVRHPDFGALCGEWLAEGVVREWGRGFAGPDLRPHSDGHSRYVGIGGMSQIARRLSSDLDVRLACTVLGVEPDGGHWRIALQGGEVVLACAALLTPPVPQSLALLHSPLPPSAVAALNRLVYEPCTALMALCAAPVEFPEPGAVQIANGEPISWLAENQRKGVSAFGPAMTLHAGPQFTRDTWDENADAVARQLLSAAQPYIGCPKVLTWQLKRWRYSRPVVLHPERCLMVEGEAPLVFAGDAFGEPRVEGAALSGLSAARRLLHT